MENTWDDRDQGKKQGKDKKSRARASCPTDEKDLKKCRGTVPVPMNHKKITT
jgi:hypothetical protein